MLFSAGMTYWLGGGRGATQADQLTAIKAELDGLKKQDRDDWMAINSRIESLKKEIVDVRKNLLFLKSDVVKAKGHTLNADQDIQKAVETALVSEPIKPIKGEQELMDRAMGLGLKTVKVLR
jgi:hypothetical protein